MKIFVSIIFSLGLLFCQGDCPAQKTIRWYGFNKTFVSERYSADSAIGQIPVRRFTRSATVHGVSCGGDDAELHIGVVIQDVSLTANESPLGTPPAVDQSWGVVAELPNAKLANGPAMLDKLVHKPAIFEGYFRVWDEGHSVGAVHPSNPHHVFEVHPAWAFRGTNVNFSEPRRVNSIAGYSGFGVEKFKPLLESLSASKWPLVYEKDGFLFVGLVKAQNFYQLPVRVTGRKTISGGHEITLDVFSDRKHTKLLYKGLAGITITGSPSDERLAIGDQTFLLGFFSVNLRKALKESSGLNSPVESIAAKSAVEFFVFGPALKSAVKTCS